VLRVALMGRSIRPGAAGVGRYARNLARALDGLLPRENLMIFLTRDAPPVMDTVGTAIRAPFPTPNEYARASWEQTLVPVQVARRGVTVYHSPNYILPFGLRVPAVVTIHDLAFLRRDLQPLRSQVYLRALTAFAVRRARAIVAVSDYTRRCVEARYPGAAGRVSVIYEGVDPDLAAPSPAELAAFRSRLPFREPFFLFVGTPEPRKNLVRLLQAFEVLVRDDQLPHRLVLIGGRGWKTAALMRALRHSPVRDRVVCPGFVSDAELRLWYAAAAAFVYPSLEEGFGLPPLEAMASGTPVIASATSAFPEVVGDAGVLVAPTDVGAIARAMHRCATDSALSHRLRAAGPRRARRFSWQTTAQHYLAVYEACAERSRA